MASFVQHGKGGGEKISAFHDQGSGEGRLRGRFGCNRVVCNGRGGRGGRGGSDGRGDKPDIATRSHIHQEWALISYDEKVKVFALRNKAEPRKINVMETLKE